MTSTLSPLLRSAALVLCLASLAGCASHQQHARYSSANSHTTSNFFPQRIYGAASPRVVADGEEVPTGGGRYQVGKPYQIAGRTYYPSEKPVTQTGIASWYGSDFHGRRTANGEVFDRNSISAAHPTMPLPSYARVTNLANSHSIIVRVNDRGPYHGGRVMDVSQRVAEALDFHSAGTARVKVEWVGRADLAGGDTPRLMATFRNDGALAQLEGFETPAAAPSTMTAEQREEPAPASPKTAREKRRIAPDEIAPVEAPVQVASRGQNDAEMMAYAAAPRPAESGEMAVAPTPVGDVPGKPTPLDETASTTTTVDESPVSTVKASAPAPLPPSRPTKAHGKQAARDAIGELLR